MSGGFRKFVSTSQNKPAGNYFSELIANLSLLKKYLKPHKKKLIAAVSSTIVIAASALISPYLMKIAIDEYIIPGDLAGLALVSLLILLSHGISWAASYWQTYLSGLVGQELVAGLRSDLFSHINNMQLDFFNKRRTGELLSRVTNDINTISELITNGFVHVVSDLLTILGIIAIMFYLETTLALIIILLIPLVILMFWVLGNKMRFAYHRVRKELARLNTDVEENITGIRTVKALNLEEANQEKFNRLSIRNMRANLHAVGIFSLFFPAMNFSRVLGEALVLGFGGIQVIEGNITLGVLAAFLSYVRRFFKPIMDLSQVYNTYQSAGASLDRINEYLSIPAAKALPQDTYSNNNSCNNTSALESPVNIIFSNVSFSYPEKSSLKVLDNFNLKIFPGDTVALVGPSGAGKSTITKLLTRLYDPSSGKIFLNGKDTQNISPEKIRNIIGVFSQDVELFNRSIEENIRYGNLNASFEDIKQAAKKTHAHEFITNLPGAYQAMVGTDGIKLSGGQKQLIALARLLLKDPGVLILDEPTSNVDTYTESLLVKAINELLVNRTVILISHRLSTIKTADEVVFLQDGKIKARGLHNELIKTSLDYRKLFENNYSLSTR